MDNRELYQKYEKAIESAVNHISFHYHVPGLDRDDIKQEIRMHCFKCAHIFNPEEQPYPISFFQKCAVYHCMTLRKTAMAKKRYSGALVTLENWNEPVTEEPLEVDEKVEIDHLLGINCKGVLSKYEYEVLELYVNGGYVSKNKKQDNARVRIINKLKEVVKKRRLTSTSHLN